MSRKLQRKDSLDYPGEPIKQQEKGLHGPKAQKTTVRLIHELAKAMHGCVALRWTYGLRFGHTPNTR